MSEAATITTQCPYCENQIEIQQNWTPGGVNDYGGWVLQCAKCAKPLHVHVGRDIQMSRVTSGAVILADYDDEVEGSKERVLDRFGLLSAKLGRARRAGY
jgi:hypothetical protein